MSVNTIVDYITRMAVNRETTTRKLVSLPNPMVEAIEDYRFQARIKTESEAIRRLIELGLEGEPILRDLLRLMEGLPADPALTAHIDNLRDLFGVNPEKK